MKPQVYLESSVISYLTDRPSRSVVIAGNQIVTQQWWDKHRKNYDLYVSSSVIREVRGGDPDAAKARMLAIVGIPSVEITPDVNDVVKALIASGAVPKKAFEDALHIAMSATNGIDYLVTWNCRHIANAHTRRMIEVSLQKMGYICPIICTPQELLGENNDSQG